MAAAGGAAGGAGAAGASAVSAVMMFLKPESTAVIEELKKVVDPDVRPEVLQVKDLQLSDFDGCKWRLEVLEDESVFVSLVVPGFKELARCGLEAQLKAAYGGLLAEPRDGADVTLAFNAKAAVAAGGPAAGADLPGFLHSIALLRRHVLAAPFTQAFAAVAAASGGAAAAGPETLTVTRVRPSEPLHVLQRGDRVTVIYAIEFADATDRAVARAICQAFVDSQRHISGGPSMNFSDKEPPLELRGKPEAAAAAKVAASESAVGYLSFALFARQLDSEAKRAAAANQLLSFRAYLDYHIKAAKAQLHSRMRARVDTWLQVLNRAQLEDPFAAREKKLASGKTFVKR